MVRLTDSQLVILSAASQREDRGVELPANVQGGAAGNGPSIKNHRSNMPPESAFTYGLIIIGP